ncbi:MAG: hypothetical protein IPK26_20760 [Planctomycetes bacterium]|nr:hypothetical protein [Planctomycetota bacterium]
MSVAAMITYAKLFVLPFLVAAIGAQNYVRVRDDVIEQRGPAAAVPTSLTSVTAAHCGTVMAVYDGQPIVNGGGATVTTNAFMNPACMNRSGAIAFVGDASGPRNQGIFVADTSGVRAIAMGCGQGGGSGVHGTCGDPAPGGGTFGGFFGGTVYAPPINEEGDVLFLADVANGPSPRGLFLYIAGNGTIVKVAAVGDPSPLGGVFTVGSRLAGPRSRRSVPGAQHGQQPVSGRLLPLAWRRGESLRGRWRRSTRRRHDRDAGHRELRLCRWHHGVRRSGAVDQRL